MRKHWIKGGVLGGALLAFLGLIFVSGQGAPPSARAQAASCEDAELHCVIISKDADEEGEFSFVLSPGPDFALGGGESQAINVELTDSITVTEEETEGWTLVEIDCNDGGDWSTVSDDSVTIDFGEFDEEDPVTVTCTFVNEMDEEEETPTATATATQTATATATATATGTVSPTATATKTPVPPTATSAPVAPISPPSTGSAGLKR